MRLWTLHPAYLDARGLVALWREGLLARQVLRGRTRGQIDHERRHLLAKQRDRDPDRHRALVRAGTTAPHPLFRVVSGGIAACERT